MAWVTPRVKGALPGERDYHVCVRFDDAVMLVFGGANDSENWRHYNDIHLYHFREDPPAISIHTSRLKCKREGGREGGGLRQHALLQRAGERRNAHDRTTPPPLCHTFSHTPLPCSFSSKIMRLQ
jgi:hypothetical protein